MSITLIGVDYSVAPADAQCDMCQAKARIAFYLTYADADLSTLKVHVYDCTGWHNLASPIAIALAIAKKRKLFSQH